MLRRSHKKSRGGCQECKRRHVKCDEGRPVCLLCTMSGRDCSFASQARSQNLSAPGSPSHGRPTSPGKDYTYNRRKGAVPAHVSPSTNASPSTAFSRSNPASPAHSSISNNYPDPGLDEAVNINHMELMVHLALDQDKDMYYLGSTTDGHHAIALAVGLKIALETPYLMHELLAFSARRLAFLHPDRSTFYLHQAVALQTRAVSLFNAAAPSGVDESNCVAVLLFSATLGHHVLADTLAKRDPGGLDAFMAHYTHCVEIHRGIYTIAMAAWPLLMESELEPILSWSSGYNSREPEGDHCQRASELIDGSSGLDDEDKEVCRLSIHYLQIGFDAILTEDWQGNRYQMIVSWPMLSRPRFISLLSAKRPEALVLLAYYALLLHYGKGMWQVGDAGTYVMGLIVSYLGPEWHYWLEYPRERMEMDRK